MGCTSNYTYILFVCENAVRLMWTPSSLSSYLKAGIPTFVSPIRLISNVGVVNIISQPSVIQEGESFGFNQSQIQVIDKQGKPISNKLVICLVAAINGKKFNYRYSSYKKGFLLKDIIKPFPGHYDFETLNPLSSADTFFPVFTDERGLVQFTEASFSIFGNLGEYSDFFI